MYVYINRNTEQVFYVVGFYRGSDFCSESKWTTKIKAGKRVAFLNGNPSDFSLEIINGIEDSKPKTIGVFKLRGF